MVPHLIDDSNMLSTLANCHVIALTPSERIETLVIGRKHSWTKFAQCGSFKPKSEAEQQQHHNTMALVVCTLPMVLQLNRSGLVFLLAPPTFYNSAHGVSAGMMWNKRLMQNVGILNIQEKHRLWNTNFISSLQTDRVGVFSRCSLIIRAGWTKTLCRNRIHTHTHTPARPSSSSSVSVSLSGFHTWMGRISLRDSLPPVLFQQNHNQTRINSEEQLCVSTLLPSEFYAPLSPLIQRDLFQCFCLHRHSYLSLCRLLLLLPLGPWADKPAPWTFVHVWPALIDPSAGWRVVSCPPGEGGLIPSPDRGLSI